MFSPKRKQSLSCFITGAINGLFLQGDYIWVEPQSKKEFDVAIGARVKSVDGRKILMIDDDSKVMCHTTCNEPASWSD